MVPQPPDFGALFRTACIIIGENEVLNRHAIEVQNEQAIRGAYVEQALASQPSPEETDDTQEVPNLTSVEAEG